MNDEYSNLDTSGETCVIDYVTLDSGRELKNVEVRYMMWGNLNESKDNVIVVCHALTGNANAGSWWGKLIGPGHAMDTSRYAVFCSNCLGGCYGTTGPASINPDTGKRYGASFPKVTIRDMVRVQAATLLKLGVKQVACVIGGSMGGMQALEWALEVRNPSVVSVASLCASGRHSAWQIGISECQRQAIKADPKWAGGDYPADEPPAVGLSVARMMAMQTYRTHPAYHTKFGRAMVTTHQQMVFDVENYLHSQGKKFNQRGFDAMSYVRLTEAMDSHDVERGRGPYQSVLAGIRIPVLTMSISSDVLYPMSEQLELAKHIPTAQHHLIQSEEGHDGFLLEHVQVGTLLRGFIAQVEASCPECVGSRQGQAQPFQGRAKL
eukprot:TRINITY_DN108906_c0_g1_i1.p1 TRINITY_DN108906_c0_g1~~TRINITY_DN108906_c0_g1_i1.p1  ORF type:complete len:379 (-),score=46.83 TRINITY_DN108906_c0_g1_i1:210-1346(-)